MLKPSRVRKQIFLVFMDFIILVACVPLALFIRNLSVPTLAAMELHILYFLPVMAFWILSMYTASFYILEKPLVSIRSTIKLIVIAALSVGFGFSLFYLFYRSIIAPKTVLVLYTAISCFCIVLWRYLYTLIYFSLKNYPNVLFIGYNNTVAELLDFAKSASYFKCNPVAVFSTSAESVSNGLLLHTADQLEGFFTRNRVDIVVLSITQYKDMNLRRILFSLLNKKIAIYTIQDFYELTTRKIPIDVLNDSWIISRIDLKSKTLYLPIKRFMDICISVIALAFLSPVLLITAILIKLTSKGPVFFKQVREGYDGKLFTILKFRSMKVDNNDFAPTAVGDTRITSIGKILRKTRIDELPQLINVLRGEMSIIGPRPERPELSEDLEKHVPFYRQRLLVRPGITGWDQVSGYYHSPSVVDTIEKLKYDLYYIKNISWYLDVSILVKTLTTMVSRGGR